MFSSHFKLTQPNVNQTLESESVMNNKHKNFCDSIAGMNMISSVAESSKKGANFSDQRKRVASVELSIGTASNEANPH